MAQLKDLLVNGVSRFIGTIYGADAKFSGDVNAVKGIFNNKENEGSTTKPVYWKDGAPVAITSYEGKSATAGTADKLGTNAGSSTQPIYFSGGVPVAITGNIANGTTGNAATATKFASAQSVALTGDITGSASSQAGWSITTTIGTGKVTNDMLAGSITNSKLTNSKVTIAGNDVSLGGSLSVDTLLSSLGLSSAMHFIGIATDTMVDGQTTTPTIWGKDSYTPVAGDVVLAENSASGDNPNVEFVYTGTWWELLGQDSSFALAGHVHGNITNDGKLDTANVIVVTDADKKITTYAINPNNIVTAVAHTNVSVAGTTKTTYKYAKTPIYAPNGLIMGGTAAAAGLVTRGICGVGVPENTGAAAKENLYINYDGDNTYRSNRQLILQAGTAGTHYGNNVYQYAAVRGDAMKAWVEAKGYSTTTGTVTSITLKAGTGISLDTDNTAITTSGTRTISLKTAGDSQLGGIKTGYSASGKNYAIKVDSNGNAYVNVPWTDTDTKVTTAANHYTPETDTNSKITKNVTAAIAAGDTAVVTGVEISRDTKGHVTAAAITEATVHCPQVMRFI